MADLPKFADPENTMRVILKMVDNILKNEPSYVKKAWKNSVRDSQNIKASLDEMGEPMNKFKFHFDSPKRLLIWNLIKLCIEMKSQGTYFSAEEVAIRLKISPNDREKFIREYNKIINKTKSDNNDKPNNDKHFGTGEPSKLTIPISKGPTQKQSKQTKTSIMAAAGSLIMLLTGWLLSVVVHVVVTGWYQILFFIIVMFIIQEIFDAITRFRIWLARKIDPRAREKIIPKILQMLDLPQL